ncbi:MAG: GAF domain-containing sensor histidine kinase [Acidobacteriota bacterium]|nr:GAF domain-containing sensor histidine kinase [Acidobacteriota bacterium]MDE3106758.1 GAF domain-containing sensor histidine kinase [Acidobacteriota bacterium]
MAYHRIRDPERLHALIDAMLLIGADGQLSTLLGRIVEASCDLVGARYGALGVLSADGTTLSRFVTHGVDEATRRAIGPLPHGAGVLGEVIRTGDVLRVDDLHAHPSAAGWPTAHPAMTHFLGVPVTTNDGRVFGNLYLTDRLDGQPFSDEDEDAVAAFGRAAALVIDQATLRQQLRESTLNEERARLARELHDTVIQRLFGVGLALQLTLAGSLDEHSREHVNDALDDLDVTIREIRTTIFEIDRDQEEHLPLVTRVRTVCDEVTARLGVETSVSVTDGVDAELDRASARALLTALREALANVARHARASEVRVSLVVVGASVELTVRDNGVGIAPGAPVGRGLENLRARAAEFDGTFEVVSAPGEGTLLRWSIPRHE